MKIAFNVCRCGLGNNGGSQTIVRMANMLWCAGNEVYIFSDINNFFTWERLQKSIFKKVPKNPLEWPKVDVIISTGVHTIKDAIKYSERTGSRHISWLRGWERWQMNDKNLVKLYSHPNVELMANSEWLVEHVSNHTRKQCRLQYSGIPHHKFKDLGYKERGDKIIIGGLSHSTKETKMFETFLELSSRFKSRRKDNFSFVSMGEKNIGNTGLIKRHISQPNLKEKVKFYNSVDIWVATSVLEGLHIPPMEAGLCGASIVVPNILTSGTHDYAKEGFSSLMYSPGNLDELEKSVLELSENKTKRNLFSQRLRYIIRDKIGDVSVNAQRLQEFLENG